MARQLVSTTGLIAITCTFTRAAKEITICYLDEIVETRQDTIVVLHMLGHHSRLLTIERLGVGLEAAPGLYLAVSYWRGDQSVRKLVAAGQLVAAGVPLRRAALL